MTRHGSGSEVIEGHGIGDGGSANVEGYGGLIRGIETTSANPTEGGI